MSLYAGVAGNRMIPGEHGHHARYGWWSDKDMDGVIDDNHDRHCATDGGSAACAVDELRWRGVASDEATPMIGWAIPSNSYWGGLAEMATRVWPFCWEVPTYALFSWPGGAEYGPDDYARTMFDCHAGVLSAYHNGARAGNEGSFNDDTALAQEHQSYRAGNRYDNLYTDDGLLVTATFVVVANPARDLGNGWDITVPEALIDVDVYDAVDPSVESLYLASASAARSAYMGAVTTVWAPIETVWQAANAVPTPDAGVVQDVLDTYVAPYLDQGADVVTESTNFGNHPAYVTTYNALYSPVAKEPNTAEDDYPSIVFDGVPDLFGYGNDYSAHRDNWLLYGDVVPEVRLGNVANAHLGPLGEQGNGGDVFDQVTGSNYDFFRTHLGWKYLDPWCAGNADEDRCAIVKLGFRGHAGAWKDLSGDGWAGSVCNPDPSVPCTPYNNGATAEKEHWWNGEVRGLCGITTLAGGTLTLRPMSGDWPPVLVVRDYDRPTRNVWRSGGDPYQTEVVADDSPITIRWDPAYSKCKGDGVESRAIDEVWFPAGTGGISVRVESVVTLVKSYMTPDGIEIPAGQSFTDVDYLVAGL